MATKPSYAQLVDYIVANAPKYGVPPELAVAQMHQESGGNASAVSRTGAFGPMQLTRGTAKELGVDRYDWRQNIDGGLRYLGSQLQKYNGNVGLALAAYNAGPGAVDKAGGVPRFAETRNYVRTIMSEVQNGLPNVSKRAAAAGGTTMAAPKAAQKTAPKDEGVPSFDEIMAAQPKPAPAAPSKAAPAAAAASTADEIPSFDEIMAAQPKSAPKAQARPVADFVNQLGRQSGLTVRGMAQGVTDLPLAVNDLLLNYVQNPIANALGFKSAPPATQTRDALLDKVLPKPASASEDIANKAVRAGTGAFGTAGVLGSVAPLVTNPVARGVTTQLAAQPGAQAVGAATGSTLSNLANQKLDVQNPYALMGIDLAGNMLGGSIVSRGSNVIGPGRGQNYQNPDVGSTVQAARNEGVNLTAAEAAPQSFGGRAVRATRSLSGMAGQRADDMATDVANMVERRTEGMRPAGVPADAVGNTGVDRAVATDLRTQYRGAKAAVRPLFERAEQLAGSTPIATPNAAQSAVDAVGFFPSVDVGKANPIRDTLTKVFDATANGGVPYKELRGLQSDLFALKEQVRKGIPFGTYNEKQLAALNKVYDGMAQDVDTWAAPRVVNGITVANPAGDAHNQAMSAFRQTVAPFRDDSLIYGVVSGRTPRADYDKNAQKLTERILSSGPETTNLATTLMSPEGNAAFRFGIANKATQAATNPDAASIFSAPAYQRGMNLGNGNTLNGSVMATDPAALAQAQETQRIVDMARSTTAQSSKSVPRTGEKLVPGMNALLSGSAGGSLASLMGIDPATGGLLSAIAAPFVARGAESALSTNAATDFMLGRQYPAALGLMNMLRDQGTGGAPNSVLEISGTAADMTPEQKAQAERDWQELFNLRR